MDERPKFRMRFVGYDQEGKLMQRAPAFKDGEVRVLPLEYAQHPWWVLIEPVPDLVLPEAREEDSVFIEEIFVPGEEGTESEELTPKGKELHKDTSKEAPISDPGKEGSEDEKPYKCPGCGREYKTLRGIKKHLEAKHPGMRYIITTDEFILEPRARKCPVCGRGYKLERNLKKHIKNKHKDWLAEQDAKKQVYRKMTVKELRTLIKELGGKVNYLHRKFEYIDYILRLKAEKEA